MRGLLGRDRLGEGCGMLLAPCSSVHTFFMRFAIDVVYLGGDGRVLKVVHSMSPWRMSLCLGARQTVELPAGTAAAVGVRPGSRLLVSENA